MSEGSRMGRWLSITTGAAVLIATVSGCVSTSSPPTPPPFPAQDPPPTSPTTADTSVGADSSDVLLEEVLGILEAEAHVTEEIDWETVRADAHRAREISGNTQAIGLAVARVNTLDRHTFWLPAPAVESLVERPPPSPVATEILEDRIGYVALSGFGGDDQTLIKRYVSDLHKRLAGLAEQEPCGWVVDLWGHDGGNMWPGLAGLAPLIGEGTVGYFLPRHGQPIPWVIGPDRVMVGEETAVESERFVFVVPSPPIAVIIGAGTASSGEAVALSLHDRPATRFFGRPTFGAATANTSFPLTDGSLLLVTTALMADRTGEPIPMHEPISPDEELVDQDDATRAAVEWLTIQDECVP